MTTLLRWYRAGEDAERRLPILSAYLGHVHVSDTFWYLSAWPELMQRGDAPARTTLGGSTMTASTTLAPLLERFFTQRLMQQRQVSPHTISSYRDTFRLFLTFTHQRLHTPALAPDVRGDRCAVDRGVSRSLEKHRGLSVRSRNLRLTAIHSFFRYAAFEAPTHAAQIQRVLAIPSKRFTRTLVHFLTRPEVEALLAAPDQRTWFGRRDHAFLLVAVQTGLRLSEMTGLTREDVILGTGAHVRVIGKGRKERCTPLAKPTVAVLKAWLREPPRGDGQVLFPNARGTRLSADGVHYLLGQALRGGRQSLPVAETTNGSPSTSCDTRWPSICCKRVWTAPSSPCGSGMNRWKPRRSISRPHSP